MVILFLDISVFGIEHASIKHLNKNKQIDEGQASLAK